MCIPLLINFSITFTTKKSYEEKQNNIQRRANNKRYIQRERGDLYLKKHNIDTGFA
jgi:hypothetical protein